MNNLINKLNGLDIQKELEKIEKSKGKKKTYQVTYEEIQKYKEQGRKEAIKQAGMASFAVTTLAVRDLYGFGEKRLYDLLTKMMEIYEDIDSGYLDIRDIEKQIKEETGIDLNIDGRRW